MTSSREKADVFTFFDVTERSRWLALALHTLFWRVSGTIVGTGARAKSALSRRLGGAEFEQARGLGGRWNVNIQHEIAREAAQPGILKQSSGIVQRELAAPEDLRAYRGTVERRGSPVLQPLDFCLSRRIARTVRTTLFQFCYGGRKATDRGIQTLERGRPAFLGRIQLREVESRLALVSGQCEGRDEMGTRVFKMPERERRQSSEPLNMRR